MYLKGLGKIMMRLVNGFIGEPEGSPVIAQGGFGLENAEGLNRIVGIHVVGRHEPARLIGPDG